MNQAHALLPAAVNICFWSSSSDCVEDMVRETWTHRDALISSITCTEGLSISQVKPRPVPSCAWPLGARGGGMCSSTFKSRLDQHVASPRPWASDPGASGSAWDKQLGGSSSQRCTSSKDALDAPQAPAGTSADTLQAQTKKKRPAIGGSLYLNY